MLVEIGCIICGRPIYIESTDKVTGEGWTCDTCVRACLEAGQAIPEPIRTDYGTLHGAVMGVCPWCNCKHPDHLPKCPYKLCPECREPQGHDQAGHTRTCNLAPIQRPPPEMACHECGGRWDVRGVPSHRSGCKVIEGMVRKNEPGKA